MRLRTVHGLYSRLKKTARLFTILLQFLSRPSMMALMENFALRLCFLDSS